MGGEIDELGVRQSAVKFKILPILVRLIKFYQRWYKIGHTTSFRMRCCGGVLLKVCGTNVGSRTAVAESLRAEPGEAHGVPQPLGVRLKGMFHGLERDEKK